MAKKPRTKTAETDQTASPQDGAESPSVQETEPEAPAQPAPEPEVALNDAVHCLVDDPRWKDHWKISVRKFATNSGLGETATLSRWRDCLQKFGAKLK